VCRLKKQHADLDIPWSAVDLAGWKIHEGGIEMFRTDTVAIDPYTDFSSWEGWL
jgi:hypothetical protein